MKRVDDYLLKPCPFCGEEEYLHFCNITDEKVCLVCGHCGGSMLNIVSDEDGTYKDLADAWNKRS